MSHYAKAIVLKCSIMVGERGEHWRCGCLKICSQIPENLVDLSLKTYIQIHVKLLVHELDDL